MTYKVEHSGQAKFDLDKILHYITFVLKNQTVTKNLRESYNAKLQILRDSPYIYPLSQIKNTKKSYRRFSFGNYIAFYSIDEEGKKVFIIRVFMTKQDYENIL